MTSHIYVIRSGELIKIGISDSPKRRLRALCGVSPIPLVLDYTAAVSGDAWHARTLEKCVHQKLKPYKNHGEWFNRPGFLAINAIKTVASSLKLTLTEPKIPAHYLSRRDAATFLTAEGFETAASTLTKLASAGGGPPFSSYGRNPVYEQDALLTLCANDDETKTCREFTLEGIGQTSSGYAPNQRQQDPCSSRR